MSNIDPKMILQIAAVCHAANAEWCRQQGDDSQPPWEAAPNWQRDSAINGVAFAVDNPDAGPAASHESWYAEKERNGWVYGETKDVNAKTHPCFRPYVELPIEQRTKDAIFLAIVRAIVTDY